MGSMNKPKLLDLYCGAGGAGMGYHRAGFDVTGVDLAPQPHFPFRFIQADALDYAAAHGYEYDAIHASPPCQNYSWSARRWIVTGEREYPDLLVHTRFLLKLIGLPYVIENVVGAPMHDPMVLCGTMFGLRVFRHRQFESSFLLLAPGAKCSHRNRKVGFGGDDIVTVAGHGGQGSGRLTDWKAAMGIDWMTRQELTQSIPPAYTEHIGQQLLRLVTGESIERVVGGGHADAQGAAAA